jgi:hypothetical protein
MGRIPAERTTLYSIRRRFDGPDEEETALDRITDSDAVFGSYRKLVESSEFRFEHPAYRRAAGEN